MAQAQAVKPEAAQETQKQTNCPACSKPLRKIKKYYRNGKSYCTKKCWLKSTRPGQENKEA